MDERDVDTIVIRMTIDQARQVHKELAKQWLLEGCTELCQIVGQVLEEYDNESFHPLTELVERLAE